MEGMLERGTWYRDGMRLRSGSMMSIEDWESMLRDADL